jgi:MFS family permease
MTIPPDGSVRDCASCRSTVPSGPFCGSCGADQRKPVTPGRKLLRPNNFVAAHRQPVYLPLITSTLCPHLASRERIPFRHGLFLALAAVIGFSAARQLPLLVVLTCFGIPLLFVLYLWRSDIFRDIPARALILTSVLGTAISVTWWLWSGSQVSAAYGIPLSAGFQLMNIVNLGLAVSVGDAVLMLVPAVAVRLLRPRSIESLDGFVIGALGALAFITAGTVTWLGSQFVSGLLDNYDSWRLFWRAMLYGIFDPLTATAAGGTLGLLLWFRPIRRPGQPRGIRLRLALCVLVTALCYVGVYAVDATNNPHSVEAAINLAITILALQTLRFAMQIAVLHEAPDTADREGSVRCIHCTAAVPAMAFCPQCGVAERASSRSARKLRQGGSVQ